MALLLGRADERMRLCVTRILDARDRVRATVEAAAPAG